MKRKMGVAVMGMVLMLGVHLQLYAQEKKPKLIALKAARLFDGKSDGLVPGGVVVVAGSKIVAAGANAPIPEGPG
jgi:imidazolonepropionase-like amidohydrolase